MEKKFAKKIESLDVVFGFISDFIKGNNVNETIAYAINFIVEELFTNFVKYNSQSNNDILINLQIDNSKFKLELTDYDVEEFDINKTKDVDVDVPLEERDIGGLGIHIVKQMADEISYDYVNRNSKITIIKNLSKENVED